MNFIMPLLYSNFKLKTYLFELQILCLQHVSMKLMVLSSLKPMTFGANKIVNLF